MVSRNPYTVSTPGKKELAFLEHYINPRYKTDSTSTDEVVFLDKEANAHP